MIYNIYATSESCRCPEFNAQVTTKTKSNLDSMQPEQDQVPYNLILRKSTEDIISQGLESVNTSIPDKLKPVDNSSGHDNSSIYNSSVSQTKRILYYNPAIYQVSRNIKRLSPSLFQKCEISDCEIVDNKSLINDSDAVILSSFMGLKLEKKPGQVWIVLQWESTQTHDIVAPRTAPVSMENKINWTMSYSTVSVMFISLTLTNVESRMSRDFFSVDFAWN